jgi:hypothetical protein
VTHRYDPYDYHCVVCGTNVFLLAVDTPCPGPTQMQQATSPRPHRWVGLGQITSPATCADCGESADGVVSRSCPGPQAQLQAIKTHNYGGTSYCQDCGVTLGSLMSAGDCFTRRPIAALNSDTLDPLRYSMVPGSVVFVETEEKTCTCPLHGPEGLLARGCSCGGS